MKEKYYKWEPVKGIEKEMWVEAIHDDYEVLRILLKGSTISSIMLSVNFSHYYMYCNVDESYRIKLWDEGEFDERNWSLYRTSSSRLIDWLFYECGGILNKDEIVHYLIKTGADVIEIITNQEPPNIKWLNAPISSAYNSGV